MNYDFGKYDFKFASAKPTNKSPLENVLTLIGGIVLMTLAFAYGAFAWGFTCWKFWYWFILPVFTTLPNITIVQAVGLMVFIGLFNTAVPPIPKPEFRDDTLKNWANFLSPIIAFIVGWLIKIFIVH